MKNFNKLKKLSKILHNLGLNSQSKDILKMSSDTIHFLSRHQLDELAAIAQKVYDEWEQDEDGFSESHGEIGYGGICHIIADKIVDYLNSAGFGSKYNFCSVSDMYVQHVYVMAWIEFDNDIFHEDIDEEGNSFNKDLKENDEYLEYEDEYEDRNSVYDVYNIDIPYWTYEEGSMFTWRKISGIKFTGDDVTVEKIENKVGKDVLKNYLDE